MDADNIIDYGLIAKALDFYKSMGYKEINVPWHVRTEVSDITCPSLDRAYPFEDGVLVGSAEQSMIQMALDGELVENISYVTCSPCFRNEPELDRCHQKYFMKVELFHFGDDYQAFRKIKFDAYEFLKSLTSKQIDIVVYDGFNLDMEINGVEIGSYNYRSAKGIIWTCGTGLALPRFTKVM
jgi:seryl-tRNA synthetase